MNRFVLAAAICAFVLNALPAAAQQQAPVSVAPTPAPATFQDPAMTFTAPAGYIKAKIPPHDPMRFDQPTVVAAFLYRGKSRSAEITIQMENFNGDLSGFEMVTENELRGQADSVFFKKKTLTTLSNGMPAYWQDITVGSGFQEVKRYQYVWIDHLRGVQLAITARWGELTQQQAKQALANAAATAYPLNRY